MLRVRTLLALAAVAAFGLPYAAARADEQGKVGVGTFVASGTKLTAEVGAPYYPDDDIDDYVIDGYAGQTLSVTVAAAKGSNLIPFVQVIRPDGTALDYADGAKITPKLGQLPAKSWKLTYKLNQTGIWTIRVRGSFVATGIDPQSKRPIYDFEQPRAKGEYTLAVKYGAPPASTTTNAVPDDAGLYTFLVPGAGAATLNTLLTFKGGTPAFDALRTPAGNALTGIVPTVAQGKSIAVKNYVIPPGSDVGAYPMTYIKNATPSTKVVFKSSLKLPKGEAAIKAKLARNEPFITGLDKSRGGPGTTIRITATGLLDPAVNDLSKIRVHLGRYEMTNVTPQANGDIILATAPADLPQGTFDLRVRSTAGQIALLQSAFTRAAPPVALTLEPQVGSESGGFPVTITGSNFVAGTNKMQVGFRSLQGGTETFPPAQITSTDSTITFNFPGGTGVVAGSYNVIVRDGDTLLTDELPFTLELTRSAAINRVTPGLVPVTGGDKVFIQGSNFESNNKVYLETSPGSGTYDEVTATQTTYVSATLHQFIAPAKPKGVYRVKVKDSTNYETPTRSFAYYSFADFSTSLGLPSTGDGYDAWSTFLADYDGDGDEDLFLSRKGNATTAATSSETRVLRNAGNGSFTDVTSAVMPSVRSDDDWRADRIWVADIDPPTSGQKGYPDIVIVTNSDRFPPKDTRSHVRILINEKKPGTLSSTDRQFVDRTTELTPPIRTMSILYGGTGRNDKDDWRGQDLWVGDLDQSNLAPPEILITGDRDFENYYVSCTPYCASPYSGGYTYSFYWGGTRMFKWDQSARSGLGRYKFDQNYFPRRSGITVAIFNPPPGVTIPTCTGGSCRGKFTPYLGQRLAVGKLDDDGRPDIAVLSNATVQRDGSTISSLQVAINRPNIGTGGDGANVTDVTDVLTALAGGDHSFFKGDAVAIGAPGYPDGNGYGAIAIAKADPTGLTGTQSALRLIRYKLPASSDQKADFQVVTTGALPAATTNDRFHASAIMFADVDQDGDDELITVARTAPGGNGNALRIFRNEVSGTTSGVFVESLKGLITPLTSTSNRFEGDALAIGDIDGDGALEFIVTRSVTSGATAPHTRAIRTDK